MVWFTGAERAGRTFVDDFWLVTGPEFMARALAVSLERGLSFCHIPDQWNGGRITRQSKGKLC